MEGPLCHKLLLLIEKLQQQAKSLAMICITAGTPVAMASLLRTRPDGIAIFPGVCADFALVGQVLSWSKQRNFQIYVEKHHFLGRTSTDSKYNTLS